MGTNNFLFCTRGGGEGLGVGGEVKDKTQTL